MVCCNVERVGVSLRKRHIVDSSCWHANLVEGGDESPGLAAIGRTHQSVVGSRKQGRGISWSHGQRSDVLAQQRILVRIQSPRKTSIVCRKHSTEVAV